MGMADKLAIVMALAGQAAPGRYAKMELPPPAPEVTIQGQSGGSIQPHVEQVVAYEAAGSHLRVTGACVSACTLILALPADRICVTPAARFGFHQPFRYDARNVPNEDLGRAMADTYPPFVRQWLQARFGGLPPGKPQFMGYDVLRQHYATCG